MFSYLKKEGLLSFKRKKQPAVESVTVNKSLFPFLGANTDIPLLTSLWVHHYIYIYIV